MTTSTTDVPRPSPPAAADGSCSAGTAALVLGVALSLVSLWLPAEATAFCGAYVNGGDSEMFNNATQAVMMREGQKTVLSIQNDYKGPTEDFAMIVPTPQVLQKKNVKTIDEEVFAKIDRLTAPRLVEYWERDPCQGYGSTGGSTGSGGGTSGGASSGGSTGGQVNVEAEFSVGEYDIVVLSADESTALEAWLTQNGYNIPTGAAPYLQPYVMSGSYFFVAKVDADEVEFDAGGRAVLSPLRFHYESQPFKLPVRLGLINSKGQQDLIVHILARQQRYRAANYPNTTIPTNLRVKNEVRNYFPSFYRALFRETLTKNRNANDENPVVTEYAWNASTCDPCPGPTLGPSDYLTLGADVILGLQTDDGGSGSSGSTCQEILDCQTKCSDGDTACTQTCFNAGSQEAQDKLRTLSTCAKNNCQAADQPMTCLEQNCSTQLQACRNDGQSGSTTGGSSGSTGGSSGGTTGTAGTSTGGSTISPGAIPRDWVITRLHARYDKQSLGKDLVFEKAPAITGGRGQPGSLTKGATQTSRNRFQGRYIITHEWDGEVDCQDPRFGRWGGKNGRTTPSATSAPGPTTSKEQAQKEDVSVEDSLEDGEETDSDNQDDQDDQDDQNDRNNDTDGDAGEIFGDAGQDNGPGTGQDSEQGGCNVAGSNGTPPAGMLAALFGAFAFLRVRRR